MQPACTLSVVVLIMSTMTGTATAQISDWAHPDCQYRFAVDVDIPQPGWNAVPLSERDICQAISSLEEYSFDPTFLAYNHVRVCEIEATGRRHTPLPNAGFHLVVDPSELVKQDPSLPIPTSNRDYYLVRFTSEGGRFPPTVGYEQVFPVGEPPRTHAYMSSYVPRLLPRARTEHECLLQSDGTDLKLPSVRRRSPGTFRCAGRRSRFRRSSRRPVVGNS